MNYLIIVQSPHSNSQQVKYILTKIYYRKKSKKKIRFFRVFGNKFSSVMCIPHKNYTSYPNLLILHSAFSPRETRIHENGISLFSNLEPMQCHHRKMLNSN